MNTAPNPAKPEEPWYLQPLMWLFLLLFGAIILMLLIGLVPWDWIRSQGAPAWVQAAGSLLGIAIAIAVPAWQNRVAERRGMAERATKDMRVLEAVRTIYVEAGNLAVEAGGLSSRTPERNRGTERASRASRLSELHAELSGILLTDMPDATMVQVLANGRRYIGTLQSLLSRDPSDTIRPIEKDEKYPLGGMGGWLLQSAEQIGNQVEALRRQAR